MQEVFPSTDRAEVARTPEERRQNFTTWGIVALAVLVSVGMAEWSKRSAADEVIVDEKILQQAIQIDAEARDSGVKGLRDEGSGKNLSDLGVSAVKPLSTAEAQSLLRRGYAGQGRGGVFDSGEGTAAK